MEFFNSFQGWQWACFSPNAVSRFLGSFPHHPSAREQNQSINHHSAFNNSSFEDSQIRLSKYKQISSHPVQCNYKDVINQSDQFQPASDQLKNQFDEGTNLKDHDDECSRPSGVNPDPSGVNQDLNRILSVLPRVQNPTCQTLKCEERLLNQPTQPPNQISYPTRSTGSNSIYSFDECQLSSLKVSDPCNPINLSTNQNQTISVVSPPLLHLTSDKTKGYIYKTLD